MENSAKTAAPIGSISTTGSGQLANTTKASAPQPIPAEVMNSKYWEEELAGAVKTLETKLSSILSPTDPETPLDDQPAKGGSTHYYELSGHNLNLRHINNYLQSIINRIEL